MPKTILFLYLVATTSNQNVQTSSKTKHFFKIYLVLLKKKPIVVDFESRNIFFTHDIKTPHKTPSTKTQKKMLTYNFKSIKLRFDLKLFLLILAPEKCIGFLRTSVQRIVLYLRIIRE